MKQTRLTSAALALFAALVACSSAASAQQPAAGAPQNLQGRTVVIDTGAFSDEKAGIARVVNALKQVDAQFEPQRSDLRNMQSRYDALAKQIQQPAPGATAQTLAQLQEQANDLKTQIERKSQDAQAAYQKRMGELLDPLQQDVANALTAYARARGIAVIIDMNRVPVIYAAAGVDITKDFIAEYNRTHPATAAPAPGTGRP